MTMRLVVRALQMLSGSVPVAGLTKRFFSHIQKDLAISILYPHRKIPCAAHRPPHRKGRMQSACKLKNVVTA